MKKALAYAFGLFLAIAMSALAIRVCERCSYEVPDGAVSCSHCGAAVSSNVAAFAVSDVSDQESASANLVEKEIQEGRLQRSKGDAEVAAALFRNALALEQIVPGEPDSKRGERIRRLLQDTAADGMKVQKPCHVCGGSGKTMFTAEVIDGRSPGLQTAVACKACSGTGRMMRDATVSEAMAARAAAARRLAALQQSRKYVAVGGAWVPLSIETNLTARQTALLKRTAAPPCQTCLGIGSQQCRTCLGLGRTECSNRKCVKGIVSEKSNDGIRGTEFVRKTKCRTCGGAGFERCSECAGKGFAACPACNGTGERAVCSRCDGTGTQQCAKCAGSGKINGNVCGFCKGEGIGQCASCKGDGRKR